MIVAQTIHAADRSVDGPQPDSVYAVALVVADEAELSAVEATLLVAGIRHIAIREPDRDMELMSIGLWPYERSAVEKYIGHLPSLK